jgi:hypothetical protein
MTESGLTTIKWTQFHDMNSGGGHKEDWGQIFIEAPEEKAKAIFYLRFGHNPDRVSCTCCGSDYSIDEHDSLQQATGYYRNCQYVRGQGYIEERSRDMDKYFWQQLNLFDPQIANLIAMAKQTESPNEAKIAANKLIEIYGGSYYGEGRGRFIPFEQFEQDFMLMDGKALVIYAKDIPMEEWERAESFGPLPEER